MISAKEFTAGVVNRDVVEKISERMKETGIKEVDFEGTSILTYTHETIAEKMVKEGMLPKNINNSIDRDKIEFHRVNLMRPKVDNINEFIHVLKKRFPEGTPCILDRTPSRKLKYNESLRSIIYIEEFQETRVIIRKYYCSKVQPKFFKEVGRDDKSLYVLTEISYVDLYNNIVQINHPKNELEKEILDILFSYV